jgi:trimeric autotransporter adhesin
MLTAHGRRISQVGFYAGVLLGASAVFGQSYIIQTVAGTTRLKSGALATSTPLRYPWGAAEDASGNIYFSDERDNRILMVDTSGNIHALAGTGEAGFSGDGGPALSAEFDSPRGLCLDGKGGLYVADWDNNRVRLINLAKGTVTTVAGNGNYQFSGEGGPATAAGLDPADIALDSGGNLYIADYLNNRIRKVSAADQTIATIAGNSFSGQAGDAGPASKAVLSGPLGISVNSQGVLYFADSGNNYVRTINQQTGMINAFAGNGNFGLTDGSPALSAPLPFPIGTAVEADGNVLILMELNYIQRVTVADGNIHIFAGSATLGFGGDGGGVSAATFSLPLYVATAQNGDILISDTGNFRVRRVQGVVINTVAGTTIANNIPATTAFLNQPEDVVGDGQGGFVIPDTGDSQVRKVSGGVITNLVGNGVAGIAAGELAFPEGITRDAQGNVYVADTSNHRVLRLVTGGTYAVVAGDGTPGYHGDHGFAPEAELFYPTAVAVDQSGNVYIADSGNCVIRMVDQTQTITTLAGNTVCGSTGNNGPASQAEVAPWDVALDSAGNLYFAEPATSRVRKINLSSMIVTPVAGIGSPGYSGDGGAASAAQLDGPTGVAVDAKGNVLIADEGNSVVRMVLGGNIWTVAGTGNFPFDVESGSALGVSIDPVGISVDSGGNIYIADEFNDRIRQLTAVVPASLSVTSGNMQTGVPGSQIPISVIVKDASGNPVGGAIVTFSVTSGSAQLSAPAVTTNTLGVATVMVTLGPGGNIQITASVGSLPLATFSLTSNGPQISTGGVEGAALSVPAVTSLASGGIATVFGSDFGGGSSFVSVALGDLVNGAVPTNFKGICVDVAGTMAPIFGVSNTQVNFQVPALSGSSASVRVVTNCGSSSPVQSSPVTVPVAAAAPEFFYFVTNANGHNPVAAADAQTNVPIAAASLFPGSGYAPAQPGEYVTVYGTGFGATNPAVAPGVFMSGVANATGTIQVLLNGQPLPLASVLYVGLAPSSPGLYQLDFQVPSGTPNGDLPLVIEVGGVQSPAGAYITVMSATP